MEADWTVEIGGEAPVIDAHWPGFIDLQVSPSRIQEIEEAQRLPALAKALVIIHQQHLPTGSPRAGSPLAGSKATLSFWTAKCDLWEPDPGHASWDPYEMAADPEDCVSALACYIDLLPATSDRLFATWEFAEDTAKAIAGRLRVVPVSSARADIVVRAAVTASAEGFGLTAYLTACGPNQPAAEASLAAALAALTQALQTLEPPANPASGKIALRASSSTG